MARSGYRAAPARRQNALLDQIPEHLPVSAEHDRTRSVHRHQWEERGHQTMPSLLRLLTVIALICGLVYAGLYALAHFVHPKPREISVTIPPDKFFKDR